MKVNFVKQQILYIALAVRQYKKMYVLTNGQMFQKESDAEKPRVPSIRLSKTRCFTSVSR